MMIGSIAKKRWAIEISHEFMNACAQIPVCTALYERDTSAERVAEPRIGQGVQRV